MATSLLTKIIEIKIVEIKNYIIKQHCFYNYNQIIQIKEYVVNYKE